MFGWVGSHGYRNTGKRYSDKYVRARHYGSKIGRWTTEDPLGIYDNPSKAVYVNGRITVSVDPSGLLEIEPVDGGCFYGCWGSAYTTLWKESRIRNGWIIQRIDMKAHVYDCSGNSNYDTSLEYYEAWKIFGGIIDFSGQDHFDIRTTTMPSRGSISIYGQAMSVRDNNVGVEICPPGMYRGQVGTALSLCSSYNPPSIWLDNQKTAKVPHRLGYEWNCCCTPTITRFTALVPGAPKKGCVSTPAPP